MAKTIERNVPFKPHVFKAVEHMAKQEQRTFKAQAAVLIEQAIRDNSAQKEKVPHRGSVE